jgi:predicted nucleotidyltransferase
MNASVGSSPEQAGTGLMETFSPIVAAALGRFRAALGLRFGRRLREVTLFGSRARGEAHEESDVDVLVVVDALSEKERAEVMDLAWRAAFEGEEYVVLSPLPYSSEQAADMRRRERRLFREIDRDGVPL